MVKLVRKGAEPVHLTAYLTLVVAGFTAFGIVLFVVSTWSNAKRD